uniref:Uncharacterized protein n=1 Tax=Rousettus aegyptiacus TaxID=9407 RepID=A0A7J8EKY9_ROUAE|nr:hypothetical protein HJG63_012542 [Rousettus aegyptiacus]
MKQKLPEWFLRCTFLEGEDGWGGVWKREEGEMENRRGWRWSSQNPSEGPRRKMAQNLPPLTTPPTAPVRVPRVEHAGNGLGPRSSPEEGRGRATLGAAPDAGRCPRHSPASRTAQGQESAAACGFPFTFVHSSLTFPMGCSRCKRSPLVVFAKDR